MPALWSLVPLLLSAQPLAPETLLLAKIKVRAEQNLSRLPNYTCLETIERSQRRAGSGKFRLIDLVRMEVALVNGREMFAYPGSAQFDERDITDIVSGGTIANGNFALHARSVFLSNAPSYQHVGETIREGRRTIRFDYTVPMIRSGFHLRVRPAEAVVGYEGSFWVDAESLDLVWLEVRVTEIPSTVPIKSSAEVLRYQRVKIGDEGSFLLPEDSDLVLIDLHGNENRNRTRFSNCRQYAGESVVRFDDAPSAAPAAAPIIPTELRLPAGLDFEFKLDTPIEAGVSAVGDALRGAITRDVKLQGAVVIPKDARVTGRLLRLQRLQLAREPIWIVGIRLERIEYPGRFVNLRARIDASSHNLPGPTRDFNNTVWWTVPPGQNSEDPRIGILYIRGERGKLSAGHRTWWRTDPPSEEETK